MVPTVKQWHFRKKHVFQIEMSGQLLEHEQFLMHHWQSQWLFTHFVKCSVFKLEIGERVENTRFH